jgi:predicted nucleotidyltransferase
LPGGVSIDVACLPALALLKIWAWEDRRYTTPGKDASDLWMFLRHHAEAGNEDRLYDQESDGLASFAFDLEKAGRPRASGVPAQCIPHRPLRSATSATP